MTKDHWETVKVVGEAVKFPLLVLLLAVIFFRPGLLVSFLDRAGFRVDAIEFQGVKLIAKKANENLDAMTAQLKDMTEKVHARDELLRQAADRLPNGDPLRDRITQANERGEAAVRTALENVREATRQVEETQVRLQGLVPVPAATTSLVGFLVVFGADRTAEAALDEIKRAQPSMSAGTPALFVKGSFYRSAALFQKSDERDAAVDAIRRAVGRQVERVTLATWCPSASFQRDMNVAVGGGTASVRLYQC